jgi:Fic/DOC family protein
MTASTALASRPVGQLALHRDFDMKVPAPAVQSYVGPGARRTVESSTDTQEFYPVSYAADGTPVGNLRFALKYEPLDLGVVYHALKGIGSRTLEEWVRTEPTGEYSRRAWFLYETLTGDVLDLEPTRRGNYVEALNAGRHFVATPLNSPRHRVRNNLLGTRLLCPTLRRTPRLEAMIRRNLSDEARVITAHYSPETLARAVTFLYTKETRSSFAIEGEAPGSQREERFLQALQRVASFDSGDKTGLIQLQQSIVDPRYASADWRTSQNFVSETTRQFGQHVHFICPRPEDVPSLMEGWMALTGRVLSSPLDPVLAAAVSAFAFVFIHPFEDANGRIHRFLIHYALAARGFSPPGVIFPVSAAILRQRHLYDRALEAFSKPLMLAIEWRWTPDGEIVVENDTLDLYRFFDATMQAEYLYERVAETIHVDLKEELEFLEVYDAAYQAVKGIVDMPNRRAGLLVRMFLQNGGRLSNNKRRQFPELTDGEVERMEAAIQEIIRTSRISVADTEHGQDTEAFPALLDFRGRPAQAPDKAEA